MLGHQVAKKLQSAAGLAVRAGVARRGNRGEQLAVGQCTRPLELGLCPSLGILLCRIHLRLPPGEIGRDREWSQARLGLVEDRESAHSGRDATRAYRGCASPR